MNVPTRNLAIEALFTPFTVRAFESASNADLIADLEAAEASALAPMAAARQAEFATARACARAALSELGVQAAVPRREGGAPLWPEGMAGSISHTRGFCLAVAGRDVASIGIDVEEIARIKPAVERRILVDKELAVVEKLGPSERRRRVATIFATKEAFYKAHYEVDPRYIGFDAIAVALDGDQIRVGPASGEVDISVLGATSARFRIDNGRVIAGVSIDVTAGVEPIRSPA